MENIFSLRRYWLLIKKQGVENARVYLLSTVALSLLLCIVFIFWMISNHYYQEEGTYMIYIFGLIIAGALFASGSFQVLSSKDKAIYYLSFPASALEKLATVFFYNFIVFPLVYTAVFYVVKTGFWTYLESLAAKSDQNVELRYVDWNNKNNFMQVFPYFFFVFAAVQAFYTLGSVYFSRFALVKTTIAGISLIFLFTWYYIKLTQGSDNRSFPGPGVMHLSDGGTTKVFELPALVNDLLMTAYKVIWAPVFLVAAYFRLKEKQV